MERARIAPKFRCFRLLVKVSDLALGFLIGYRTTEGLSRCLLYDGLSGIISVRYLLS
jgi:hypothetical protein